MQAFAKRFMKFKKLPATISALRPSGPAYMKVIKKGVPLASVTMASLYMLNASKSCSSFAFSTRFAAAESNTTKVELTGMDDLEEGCMANLKVGEEDGDKILIAKYDGKLYALSNFCSHLGVPLAGGVLFDDKLICPAHNAAFSILDGTPEEAPAMNGLQKFEIVEEDGKKFVVIPSDYKGTKPAPMATRDESNDSKFVIVGGGAAGLAAAETLRQSDYTGQIIILSKDDKIAYDRTLLSKALAKGDANKFILRQQDFLDKYGIEFKTNSTVKSINTESGEVVLSDDTTVPYHKLLIATGAQPRKLPIPGIDLEGVFTLRSATDQENIKNAVGEDKTVVIIGASFIGYECAANLVSNFKDKVNVHVVDMAQVPMQHVVGNDVGKMFQSLAEENGVKFRMSSGMKKFVGKDGKVTGVQLEDGSTLDADVVIVGVGVQPATQFVGDNIDLSNDGSVNVDPFMKTSADNIYAAGDIANYPYWVTGERARVEHWSHAQRQGEIAAYNMLDKDIPYENIPFFWTRNYNLTLQYTGYVRDYDEIHIDGDIAEKKFIAYYIKDKHVRAAAALNKGPAIHIIKEALRLGIMPEAAKFKDGSETIDTLKQKIKEKASSKCTKKQCCSKKKVE